MTAVAPPLSMHLASLPLALEALGGSARYELNSDSRALAPVPHTGWKLAATFRGYGPLV